MRLIRTFTTNFFLDDALRTEDRQEDALFLLNLWFRTGKVLHKRDRKPVKKTPLY